MITHSAIVITRNRPDEIERLLGTILEQTHPPTELVLVDASDDDETGIAASRIHARTNQPALRYIRTGPNISAQKNVGLSAASGEIVSFFDDDVLLEPDYCEVILRRFQEDSGKSIGGIGGLLRNPPVRSAMERWFRALFLIQTDRGRNAFRPSGFPDPGYGYDQEAVVAFLASTAVSFRRTAIDTIRFEEYWLTGTALGFATGRGFSEDVLFSSTIGATHRLIILPSARFTHAVSDGNREDRCVTQALYVFSLRYVSKRRAQSPHSMAARWWALFGQGILCAMQAIRYRDPGYLRGYLRAMTARME